MSCREGSPVAQGEERNGSKGSKGSPSRPEGSRLSSLEEEARIADERLRRLEAASREMKGEVEMLAEATGGMRQQSAKMREAALRVAEVVKVAAKRRREAAAK